MFCLSGNLTFALISFKTFITIDSPRKFQSSWHLKYSTVWYYLILWFWYNLFNFAERLVLEKRMHYVSSSPRWIDNLLSTSHSQIAKNSLFKISSNYEPFFLDREWTYHQYKDKSHFLTMFQEDHWYVSKRKVLPK